jgi:hypothetical protein
MDYQTLTDVLGQSKMGAAPAPSLNSIIQGIQSQYQPAQTMPVQSGLYGANRFISGSPQFGAIEQVPEYGALEQLLGPSFVPSEFNRDVYSGIDSQRLSDLISTISGDGVGYGGNEGNTAGPGFTIGPTGFSVANETNSSLAALLGTLASMTTGIPGLSYAGRSLADRSNFANSQAGMAYDVAVSDTTNAANLAGINSAAATTGASGTGAAAAAAGAAAAAAAAAAGHSDAAIGAAAQAAADAAVSGGNAAAAGAQAAADADGDGIGGAGTGYGDAGGYGGGYGGGDTSGGYGGDAGYGA